MLSRRALVAAAAGVAIASALITVGVRSYFFQPSHGPEELRHNYVSAAEVPGTGETYADRFLAEFPDSIPEAMQILKMPVSGSKKCVVHVVQMHYRDPEDLEKLCSEDGKVPPPVAKFRARQQMRAINSSQKGVLGVLTYLKGRCGVTEVWDEGATGDVPYTPEEATRAYDRLMGRIEEILFVRPGELRQFEYAPGATLVLAKNGEMTLRPAETKEGSARGIAGADRNEREDIALGKIRDYRGDTDPHGVNVLVFGALHDFSDNVIEWNEKNPANKMSLIRVVPRPVE